MPAFTSIRIARAPVAARPVVTRAAAINNEIRKDLDKVTNSLKVGKTDDFTKSVRCALLLSPFQLSKVCLLRHHTCTTPVRVVIETCFVRTS